MKVRALAAAVTLVSLSWLGISFATPSDAALYPLAPVPFSAEPVDAEHPDSHRLGALLDEEVPLPHWDKSETTPSVLAFRGE